MPGVQVGHYSPGDLTFALEHDGTVLAELADVNWSVDPKVEAAGSGLGLLKNTYYKTTGPVVGNWKITRALLQRSDKGMLFLDLIAGNRVIQEEGIATAAVSYTVSLNTALVSILEIRLNTSLQVLREGLDFTINYVTGVVTFALALPEAATIRYLASSRKLQQFLLNTGFEDALTNTWIGFGTGTVARNSTAANVASGSYALAVTPSALNDGFQYNVSMTLEPGRTYRVRFWAKAPAAEIINGFWYDGTTDQAMSPANVTLSTTYAAYEFTFTPTKAVVPNLKFKDSKASPALFYIDNITLIDDTTGTNPTLGSNVMDAGLSVPFQFNIIVRRMIDGVIVYKLMRCAVTGKLDIKSGNKYAEDVSGEFLDLITE